MEDVASTENLFRAARKARLGKSRRPDVEEWWMAHETHLLSLQRSLLDGSYEPGGYRFFEITRPKRRIIAAAPFGDRVVHHALCQYLGPLLSRRFIARSYSCQVGKGTTAARECCRQLTNRHRYVLKCDVRKFFPTIDHAILSAKLAPFLACERVVGLVERLIGSFRTDGSPPERPCGVPIGNLTSQLWGNFYLDALDHWVTEQQRHGAYVRYTDDFLLFGDNKARLWELRGGIVEQLAAVRQSLSEPKSRLLRTSEGVPYCGFLFRPGLRPRVLGETKRRFIARRRALARAGDLRRLSIAVFSWYQFSREANSAGLRKAWSRGGAMPRSILGNN